ncbi:MAG: YitT family protein [Actinomycetes bacterium]
MASIGQWLRPALTVPKTSWSAGESNWKVSPKTFMVLMLGLWLFGTGEAFLVDAGIGQSPWTVLAYGLAKTFNMTIGETTFFTSVAVLLLWIPLKRRPGLGTVMNIVVVATALEVMIKFLPSPTNFIAQFVEVLIGIAIVGLASGLYITCNVGPGPRDGLMTGLNARTGIRVGRVRLAIEVVVLTIGWFLGGIVGIGTLLFALLIGQAVAMAFGLVERLSPHTEHLG